LPGCGTKDEDTEWDVPCVEGVTAGASCVSETDLSEEQSDDGDGCHLDFGGCPVQENENDDRRLKREHGAADEAVKFNGGLECDVLARQNSLQEHSGHNKSGETENQRSETASRFSVSDGR